MRLFHLAASLGLLVVVSGDAFAETYRFKVKNTTDRNMVKLLVSEDGKKWGQFDIGKGIPANGWATLEWSEATNDQGCSQKVKAAYDDGTESEPAEFDFCEKDLELEF